MKDFYMIKTILGGYRFQSQFYRSDLCLLLLLLDEIWGHEWKINFLQKFLGQEKPEDDYHTTGFNDVDIEDDGRGFIVITYEWAEGYEFCFPKEKLKNFVHLIGKTAKKVYSMSICESPDLLQFTIDGNWDATIDFVYLNDSESFFEKNKNELPQFSLGRVKEYQYKLVQNDYASFPTSLVLGSFIEDVWIDPKILIKSVRFKNSQKNGTVYYGRTFLKKEADQFILGLGKENNPEHEVIFSGDAIHRLLVSTELFLNSVHDAPLDKLPGVIFFTFDKYWNLIPVPLFRPEDKNFVDKE